MSDKPASTLLSTADPVAELRWDSLLELQVATYLPYELSFFLSWPRWSSVNRVLDAGCGNGYFLAHLKRYFPTKSYGGLDLSPQLVAAARQNPWLQGVEIVLSDFFSFQPSEPYDAVVMRLIVQHMSGFDRIFGQLDRLVTPGGSVVIVEPEPHLFLNYPRTPLFEQLLVGYTEATASQRLNRAILTSLEQEISKIQGWTIREDRTLIAPYIGPFRNTPLMQIFDLWLGIFEQSRAIAYPFDEVRAELECWANNDTTYSQVGVRIVEVQRAH